MRSICFSLFRVSFDCTFIDNSIHWYCMPCIAWVLLIKSVSGKRIARVENINHFVIKFQFVEQNNVECWCDFGANLVQHFIKRYSRYSRYRTKTHDKATISHDISRYSRYQMAFLKLQEIIAVSLYHARHCNLQCLVFSFVRRLSLGRTEEQMKHTPRCMKNEAGLRPMKRGFATRRRGVLRFIEAAGFCFIATQLLLPICAANAKSEAKRS